jgi:hypothetical protein
MRGYHDCPPHLFDSLSDPRDAQWREDPEKIRENIQRGLDRGRKELAIARQNTSGVRIRPKRVRYK